MNVYSNKVLSRLVMFKCINTYLISSLLMSADLYFWSVVFVARIECRVPICFSSVLPFLNQQNNFFSVTMKSDFFRSLGMFYFLYLFIRVFITGAPLVTNQILPLTLYLQTADDFTVPTVVYPNSPFEEVLTSCRPTSRDPFGSILFCSFDPFPLFAFCVLFQQMFTFAPSADI